MTKPLSLEEASLDEIRDLVESSSEVRAEIYHAGHQSLELRSPEHRGYRFRALNRVFSIRTLKVNRKTYHGVYEIMTDGVMATRPADDPDDRRGYRYGTGTIAYLTRHRLISITKLHEAIATPVGDRLMPGRLVDKLAPGQGKIELALPRTLQLANLHQHCRDALGYPRAVYAQIIGANSQFTIKNWEFTKSRIPGAVWPELVKLLRARNTTLCNRAAEQVESLALGRAPSPHPINPHPQSRATPVPMDVVRAASAAAVDAIQGGTTSRYMRGYQDEQQKLREAKTEAKE